MAADYSELPPELLQTIAKKLKIHTDYIRFRAVCFTLRSSTPNIPTHLPCQLPWLMLSPCRKPHRRAFLSLADNKFNFLHFPEASIVSRRCGSSHGWLVILDESPSVFLLNPLTRVKLLLPPLSTFPKVIGFSFFDVGREYTLCGLDGDVYTCNLKEMRDSYIRKVILSTSPSKNLDFFAVAILNQSDDLAFCKNGDDSWKSIENTHSYSEDVIYDKGLIYAVNKFGGIVVCDVVNLDSPSVSFIDTPPQKGGDMQYLVSYMHELLLVTRYLELQFDVADHNIESVYRTIEFQVFKLDMSDGPKWERMMSLGDRVLFLGENSSLALSAADFPGCKGNCIYYTDDYYDYDYYGISGDHDLGIYNLEDGTCEALTCYPRNSHSGLRWSPPIWLTPNPC